MKVRMKEYETWCLSYSERYNRNWELTCVTKDSWLAGFNFALSKLKEQGIEVNLGQEEVEVEFKDGEHQLK